MREDYKLKGATTRIELELEQPVVEALTKMEGFSKFSRSELTNTALKRFISTHKDFLPPAQPEGKAAPKKS
jgi:hypothetical protein